MALRIDLRKAIFFSSSAWRNGFASTSLQKSGLAEARQKENEVLDFLYANARWEKVRLSAIGSGERPARSFACSGRGPPDPQFLNLAHGREIHFLVITITVVAAVVYLVRLFAQLRRTAVEGEKTLVEIAVCDDGKDFTVAGTLDFPARDKDSGDLTETVRLETGKVRARFVRVTAVSIRTCPAGHFGAGGKAWLFADEIVMN